MRQQIDKETFLVSVAIIQEKENSRISGMIRIMKLDHVVLRAKATVKLVEFYCMVLGCTVGRTAPEMRVSQLLAREGTVTGSVGTNIDDFEHAWNPLM